MTDEDVEYAAAWKTIQRRGRITLAFAIPGALYTALWMAGIVTFDRHKFLQPYVLPIAIPIVLANWYLLSACPRCGRSFLSRWWQFNLLPEKCVHCGLPYGVPCNPVIDDAIRVLEVALSSQTRRDKEVLRLALKWLLTETPSLAAVDDEASGRVILKGNSEDQLTVAVERITREFGAGCRVGALQVAYRETISDTCEIDYTHKRLTGGSGQFARVKIRFEPSQQGSGYRFENDVVVGNVPKEFIPGVEKGLKGSIDSGVLAGFPVIDFKATLYDGAYHDTDSSTLAFEIAARAAFKEGMRKAGPILLEPVMSIEITTPQESADAVIADLKKRRGEITSQDRRDTTEVVSGRAPVAELLGYTGALGSLSQGRATFTMSFSHYAPAPNAELGPPFQPSIGMRA